MRRLGILISGRGSNMAAIARSVASGALDADIAVVISNRDDAEGLDIARGFGLTAVCLPSRGIDRNQYDRAVLAELRCYGVELVCLAGYLRLLSAEFVRAWPERIVNIHPSLLPAFPGLDAQHQAWSHGVKVTGCTVHFVNEDLDSGPIIMQTPVSVLDEDTPETLSARILAEEHRTYTESLRLVLAGRYTIKGRRVGIGQPAPEATAR